MFTTTNENPPWTSAYTTLFPFLCWFLLGFCWVCVCFSCFFVCFCWVCVCFCLLFCLFFVFLFIFLLKVTYRPMGPGVIYFLLYHCFVDVQTHTTIIKYLITLLTYSYSVGDLEPSVPGSIPNRAAVFMVECSWASHFPSL